MSPLAAGKWGRDRSVGSPRPPGFWSPESWTPGQGQRRSQGLVLGCQGQIQTWFAGVCLGVNIPEDGVAAAASFPLPLRSPSWAVLDWSWLLCPWLCWSLMCYLSSPTLWLWLGTVEPHHAQTSSARL